jgi:hypothetical protein
MTTRFLHRALLAAAALTAAPLTAVAGTGTIEGVVVDTRGAPLAGARVTITCGAVVRRVALDRGGGFSVAGLPSGACTVTADGGGLTAAVAVAVGDGATASVLLTLRPPAPPPAILPEEPAVAMAAPAAEPMPAPRPANRRALPAAPAGPIGAGAMRPPPPPRIVRLDDDGKFKRDRLRADDKAEAIAGERIDDRPGDGGFAPVRVFPVPLYTAGYDGPRTDFRETIYWNPTVVTDARGDAEVSFPTSDAITAFRVTAEGFGADGSPGAGAVAVTSKRPLTLDAQLPVAVTAGDRIELPITVANQTEQALDAELTASFGPAFRVDGAPPTKVRLKAGGKHTVIVPLEVVATDGDATVALAVKGRGLTDEVTRAIRVVPRGFPFERSAAGTAKAGQVVREELDLTGAEAGSIAATVTMYPSALASMTQGLEGMIREPGGCFEQTSSTNYPNVMVLAYLAQSDDADPALVERSRDVLDKGYRLLTGYETKERGYEWFGQTPGHEALTAYGLMEFADMAKVYDVDRDMVERTATWLMSRRDGQGGFRRSTTALDSFGRASPATTDAYIVWALAEAGRTGDLGPELAALGRLAATTRDPYLLALATNAMFLAGAPTAPGLATRLAAMQAADGGFPGAAESITKSGGESLTIETTALATLALLKAGGAHAAAVRSAVDYLNDHRGGYGEWSNTQATVLGLKALTAYAEASKQIATAGSATVTINGRAVGTIEFAAGHQAALVWDDLAGALRPGKNVIELALTGPATLPYSIAVDYRAAQPQSSPAAKVAVTTELTAARVAVGEGVTLRATVENRTGDGVPMTLARIGLPGGLVAQTWQLKELRERGTIDFYETRPREVIVYWRALAPSAKHTLDLKLLAAVPGRYEAPASSAYLYYTDEDKQWAPALAVEVTR